MTMIKRQLVGYITSQSAQMSGRRYQIDWNKLDARELLEVKKLLDDLGGDKRIAVRRAQTQPWRSG